MANKYYIGLMSGTSLDHIDTVLINCTGNHCALQCYHHKAIPDDLRKACENFMNDQGHHMDQLTFLDVQFGKLFAKAAMELLEKAAMPTNAIQAIGSHGQTIWHQPTPPNATTVQVGDPNIIAEVTGITTVGDFRRRNMAVGGQGAPLTPAFHHYAFAKIAEHVAIVNIGGIANITILTQDHDLNFGFDVGPGNCLLNSWCQHHLQKRMDENGQWARQGKIHSNLLNIMLADSYFSQLPPKSTGREYFNLQWIMDNLAKQSDAIPPEDVQATLTELTAQVIAQVMNDYGQKDGYLLVCGGGIHNKYLFERIRYHCVNHNVTSTERFGIPPDWLEAMAFAWLAKQALEKKPVTIAKTTGASHDVVLGALYQ